MHKLYQLQANLDAKINAKFNKSISLKKLIDLKILALYVELGELANETRCFKYWSINATYKSQASVLEEYADGLHFLLSIGNEIEQDKNIDYFSKKQVADTIDNEKNILLFLDIYKAIAIFVDNPNELKKNHEKLMHIYITLGCQLGFDKFAIIKAYEKKNQINHERLASNY